MEMGPLRRPLDLCTLGSALSTVVHTKAAVEDLVVAVGNPAAAQEILAAAQEDPAAAQEDPAAAQEDPAAA
jgi:hypothetical protein